MPRLGLTVARLPLAGVLALAGIPGAAVAQDLTIAPSAEEVASANVELIDSSRLGCGQGMTMWAGSGGTQCAFDSATHGARLRALQPMGSGSLEAYATIARTTTGAFTPDQLLSSPGSRASEATDFMLVGLQGSALDNRLKIRAEFARTQRVVEELLERDWALSDWRRSPGTSAMVRLDAALVDRPGLKWSLAGEYRSVSDNYMVGPSNDLLLYYALPGSRLALSSKARIRDLGLNASWELVSSEFGESSTHKATLDFQGVTLTLRTRETRARLLEATDLAEGRTHSTAAYLDLDSETLASWLFPSLEKLPFFVPTSVSIGFGSGETENRYQRSADHYKRSNMEADAAWDTPLGETGLSYWRDSRSAVSGDSRSWANETFQISHSVRRGHWRFGLDASLSRTRGVGDAAYSDRNLSFGQSVAYSTTDGPEFRLQMGQDRGRMRMSDDSYAASESYSSITASLDLSRRLQKHFGRQDLKLTLDYRKALDRSEEELSLFDQLVERWSDGYRREGLLMSFGMKL